MGTEAIRFKYRKSAAEARIRYLTDFTVTASDTTTPTYLHPFSDETRNTYYNKKSNSECYLELDFGEDLLVDIKRL